MTVRMKGTRAKSIRKKKARERNRLALNLKFTDRSELRQKGAGWGPNYAGQKAKQEVSLYAFYQQAHSSQNKWVGEVLWVWWLPQLYTDLHFQIYWVIRFSKWMFEVALKFGSDSIPQKCKLGGRFETGLEPRRHNICCCLWKSFLNTRKPVADLQSNQFPKWELIRSRQGNTSQIQTC